MGLEIPGCFKAPGPWFAWVWRCLHRRWEIRLWLQNPGRRSVQTPPSPPFPPGNQSRTAGRTLTLLNVFPGSAAPWRSLRVNGWNQHFPSAPWSSRIPWPRRKEWGYFRGIFAMFCFTLVLGFLLQNSCDFRLRHSHTPVLGHWTDRGFLRSPSLLTSKCILEQLSVLCL